VSVHAIVKIRVEGYNLFARLQLELETIELILDPKIGIERPKLPDGSIWLVEVGRPIEMRKPNTGVWFKKTNVMIPLVCLSEADGTADLTFHEENGRWISSRLMSAYRIDYILDPFASEHARYCPQWKCVVETNAFKLNGKILEINVYPQEPMRAKVRSRCTELVVASVA
jgi:hypothetical protein